MTPQLKAALQEIALSHSQGMYMRNPDGEFVPVNAEALTAQLESELQPEIERLENLARIDELISLRENYSDISGRVMTTKTALTKRVMQLTQSNPLPSSTTPRNNVDNHCWIEWRKR